jgi:hypothetical protein
MTLNEYLQAFRFTREICLKKWSLRRGQRPVTEPVEVTLSESPVFIFCLFILC